MPNSTIPHDQVLALLQATPRRIAELTAALSPAQLRAAPAPDAWSANDVLAHLRACADIWGGCMATILAEDTPTIRAVNPRSWIKRTDYPDLEFHPSLRSFTIQRADLLTLLDPLPPDAWPRTAIMTHAGAPIVRTMHSFAQRLARHERQHLKQFVQLVATLRSLPA